MRFITLLKAIQRTRFLSMAAKTSRVPDVVPRLVGLPSTPAAPFSVGNASLLSVYDRRDFIGDIVHLVERVPIMRGDTKMSVGGR